MNSKTKLIIAIITLVVQLLNLIFLSKSYPELSVVILIVSYFFALAIAGAVAVAFAVIEYLEERKK
jgi:hypothetical protein